jgi:hypothetical protein
VKISSVSLSFEAVLEGTHLLFERVLLEIDSIAVGAVSSSFVTFLNSIGKYLFSS